jgi:ABC-type Fe3+/spermidine/putrescine transport system ATPase subunit
MALLEVGSVFKSYAGTPVLQGVTFDVDEGEVVSLLGPSGCGKTTMLRIIAGLETSDSGNVSFDGLSLANLPVHRRDFGLMFQDYALFPHQDVQANVAFGLRMKSLNASQVKARATEMLALVGLVGYERRRVYDLSGGEQQRVALARSLAPDPRLLMLDEPLGSLDRALREELMNELRAILGRVGVTTIYVTHDQQEAFAVADRVIIMNRGRIVQQGTPQAVYHHPASSWVARFLGLSNLLAGRVVSVDPVQVSTQLGLLALAEGEQQLVEGGLATILIRPEGAHLAADCPAEEGLHIDATVRECSFRGGHYRLVVQHGAGVELTLRLVYDGLDAPQPGQTISLALRWEAMSMLPEEMNGPEH